MAAPFGTTTFEPMKTYRKNNTFCEIKEPECYFLCDFFSFNHLIKLLNIDRSALAILFHR